MIQRKIKISLILLLVKFSRGGHEPCPGGLDNGTGATPIGTDAGGSCWGTTTGWVTDIGELVFDRVSGGVEDYGFYSNKIVDAPKNIPIRSPQVFSFLTQQGPAAQVTCKGTLKWGCINFDVATFVRTTDASVLCSYNPMPMFGDGGQQISHFNGGCWCKYDNDQCAFKDYYSSDSQAGKVIIDQATVQEKAGLKIYKDNGFKKVMNIKMRAVNNHFLSLTGTIVVCGLETLTSVSQTPIQFVGVKNKVNPQFYTIKTATEVEALFTLNIGANSHADCGKDIYQLYEDSAGTTPFVHKKIFIDFKLDVGDQMNLVVKKDSGIQYTEFFLVAKTKGLIQDFVPFQVEICADEKNEVSAGNFVQTYAAQAGSLRTIPVTTYMSWFQVLNPTTTTLCVLEKSYLCLSSSCSNIWVDPLIYFDTLGTSVNGMYPIIVNINSPFLQKVLYVMTETKGGVQSKAKRVHVEICGSETVTATAGEHLLTFSFNAGGFSSISEPTSTAWFSSDNMGVSSTECVINNHGLYQDQEGVTAWADPLIVHDTSVPIVNLNYPIKISLSTPFAQKTVFMVAKTVGLKIAFKAIKIEVCGAESIAIGGLYNILKSSPQTSQEILATTTSLPWYSVSYGGGATQCTINSYNLFSDALGTSAFSDPRIVFDTGTNSVTFMHPIKINISTPMPLTTFYLVATTIGGVKNGKQINVEVCGHEIITLLKTSDPDYLFQKNTGTQVLEDVRTWFSVNSIQCLITEYKIQSKDASGNFVEYLSTQISLNSSGYNLEVSTSEGIDRVQLYLYSKTAQGIFNRQPFHVESCGNEEIKLTVAASLIKPFKWQWQSKLPNDQKMQQRMSNVSLWANSTNPRCPITNLTVTDVNGSPYSPPPPSEIGETWDIILDKPNDQIVVSTFNNMQKKFGLKAESLSGNFYVQIIDVQICGQEKLSLANGTRKEYRFQRNTGSAPDYEVTAVDFKSWFLNNDTNCPITHYYLQEAIQSRFINYTRPGVFIGQNSTQLKAKTNEPSSSYIYVRANTEMGAYLLQEVQISICGAETVFTAQQNAYLIYFDDMTKFVIPDWKIKVMFQSDDMLCPVTSYAISSKADGEGNSTIEDYIQHLDDGSIAFDFFKIYNLPNEPMNVIFYVVAKTASKRMAYQQINLARLTCDRAKVSADQTFDLQREFMRNSTFKLKQSEYLFLFTSSYQRKCPITSYKFATENEGFQLYDSMEGLAFIDSEGDIRFDFEKLWALQFEEMKFWLVGKTEANYRAYMPFKMKKAKIPKYKKLLSSALKQATVNATFIGQAQKQRTVTATFIGHAKTDKEQQKNNSAFSDFKGVEKNLEMSNSDIGHDGSLHIWFSLEIFDESKGFNLSSISNKTFKLSVISQRTQEPLELIWTVVSFKNQEILIKLSFADPLAVSYFSDDLRIKDQLLFEILDPKLFRSDSGQGTTYLNETQLQKTGRVSKQLKNDTASVILKEQAQNVKNGMNSVLIGQFVMNLMLSASLSYVIGTFNILQIICFQTMMNLHFPGNAQFMANQIITILNVDILDPSLVFDLFFNFESENQIMDTIGDSQKLSQKFGISEQIKSMDFETYNPIQNVGGLFMVICILVFQFMMFAAFKVATQMLRKLRNREKASFEGGKSLIVKMKSWKFWLKAVGNYQKTLRKGLIWGAPLLVSHESVTQLTMACLLFVIKPREIEDEEIKDPFTSWFSFFFVAVCFIMLFSILSLSIRLWFLPRQARMSGMVSLRYNLMVEELRPKSRWSMLNNIIFIGRRILSCFIYLFWNDRVCFQIQSTLFMGLMIMIYTGLARPYRQRTFNNKEMVNELIIVMVTTNLILFSDFAADKDFQYDIGGWGFCFLLGLAIVFNLFFVLRALFKTVSLVIIKTYNRLQGRIWKAREVQEEQATPEIELNILDIENMPSRVLEKSELQIVPPTPGFGGDMRQSRLLDILTAVQIEEFKQMIYGLENEIQIKITQTFKASRDAYMDEIRLLFLSPDLSFHRVKGLQDGEFSRIFFEFQTISFFIEQLPSFMEQRCNEINPGVLKPEPEQLQEFRRHYMYSMHAEYGNYVRSYLTSNRFRSFTNGQSFDSFSKSLTISCVKAAYLDGFGRIKKELIAGEPTDFGFFELIYSDRLAYAKEMESLSFTESHLNDLYLNIEHESQEWKLDTLIKNAQLSSEERTVRLLRLLKSKEDLEITQIRVKQFYTLIYAHLELKCQAIQERQQQCEVNMDRHTGDPSRADIDLKIHLIRILKQNKFTQFRLLITRFE